MTSKVLPSTPLTNSLLMNRPVGCSYLPVVGVSSWIEVIVDKYVWVSQNTKNKRIEEQVDRREADSIKVFVLDVLTSVSFTHSGSAEPSLHSSSSGPCQIGSKMGDDRRPQDLGLAECVWLGGATATLPRALSSSWSYRGRNDEPCPSEPETLESAATCLYLLQSSDDIRCSLCSCSILLSTRKQHRVFLRAMPQASGLCQCVKPARVSCLRGKSCHILLRKLVEHADLSGQWEPRDTSLIRPSIKPSCRTPP